MKVVVVVVAVPVAVVVVEEMVVVVVAVVAVVVVAVVVVAVTVVAVAVVVVAVVLVTVVVVAVVVVVVTVVAVAVVVVAVVLVTVEVVAVTVVVVHVHESHMTGQSFRTAAPAMVFRLHDAATYGASFLHSAGSPRPLQTPVVVDEVSVVVVCVVVVAVSVVVVVDAMHESHAIGQSAKRAGNAWHCDAVTPLQSAAGSAVRSGSAPLQSSQSWPDQGWSQSQAYLLTPASEQEPWSEQVTPKQSSMSLLQSAPPHPDAHTQLPLLHAPLPQLFLHLNDLIIASIFGAPASHVDFEPNCN